MLGLHIQPNLSPTADARLIVANTIMRYSTVELEQAISRELDENPALELAEHVICPICAWPLYGSVCASCTASEPGAHMLHDPEYLSEGTVSSTSTEEDHAFWTTAQPLTLAESLLEHLRLILGEREQEIALHIVGNLDEHGYFTSSPEELARMLQVEVSQVQRVLHEIQELDPPGIGACTVEECLLLQIQRLERQGVTIPLAVQAIIRDHLEALGHHHFEHIRRVLRMSLEEVEAAFLFIRTNLHPYPAHHYYGQCSNPPPFSLRVKPSALIHCIPTEPQSYEVEVVEPQRFLVRVNPLYRQLQQRSHLVVSAGEREHVTRFLERARLFIGALQRRHQLLQQLVTYLVWVQRDFLDHGPRYLRPLTQTHVAKELGVHASTVSRAIAGKFVQLPSQDLLPLQRFFAAETRAQDLVRQMILQETSPLSDEQIARLLREEQGITISRQMIANYRADLKIPAARQRALLRRRKRNFE